MLRSLLLVLFVSSGALAQTPFSFTIPPEAVLGIRSTNTTWNDTSLPIAQIDNNHQTLVRFDIQGELEHGALITSATWFSTGNVPSYSIHLLKANFFSNDNWLLCGPVNGNGMNGSQEVGQHIKTTAGGQVVDSIPLAVLPLQKILDGTEQNYGFRMDYIGNLSQRTLSTVLLGVAGNTYGAGDANRDGVFNSSDLVQVFAAGSYDRDALWETGDWTGDGRFDTDDIVAAFQAGTYVAGAAALAEDIAELE